MRDHLTTIKPPHGVYSSIVYYTENNWEAAGAKGYWKADSGPVTIEQSTAQAYRGTGSLKVNLSGISTTTSAQIARSYDPPEVRAGLMPSDLILYLYVPSGAPALLPTVTLQYAQGTDTYTPTTSLTAGQWNELRVTELRVGQPLAKIALAFRTAVDGESYTGPVYVDHLFYKGVTDSLKDAEHQVKTVDFSHDWANQTITVKRLDPSGTYQGFAHTYNRAGQVTNVTDPLGNMTTLTYDDDQRLEAVQAPGGGPARLTYYPERNDVHTATTPANDTTRQGVDTTTSDPRYTLDARNEKRRADGLDFVATVYRHNSAGNITSVQVNRYAAGTNLEQDPLPAAQATLRTTSYTYDAGGLKTSMTDPNGNVTHYRHQNGTGYLTEIDAPPGNGETTRRITSFTYNADGSVQQTVDPKGQTTTYEYDNLGRLRKVNYGVVNGTPAFSVSSTFDVNGNLTAMTDQAGSSSWSYDKNNQVTSESRTQNGVTKTASYSYAQGGQLVAMTTFSGQTVGYSYDAALRLSSQTDPNDGGRAISYGYDNLSQVTSVTFPSGVKQQVVYDTGGRMDVLTLQKSDGTLLQKFDYDYGLNTDGTLSPNYWNGNVLSATELDGSTVSYGYDELNRLSAATRTGSHPFNHSYSYDANDNRTQVIADGTTTTFSYDTANQLIQEQTTIYQKSYSYDRSGNLVAYGGNSLVYDAANRWSSGTVDGTSVAFAYDGQGRRVSRTVANARTDYWYDVTGLTLETGAITASYLRDLGGNLRSISSGGSMHNYAQDRLGSITALVSTSGTLANSYTYDPWGQAIAMTGTAYNPYQYTGTYLDEATGLYQMGARYYQPGEWLLHTA